VKAGRAGQTGRTAQGGRAGWLLASPGDGHPDQLRRRAAVTRSALLAHDALGRWTHRSGSDRLAHREPRGARRDPRDGPVGSRGSVRV